MTDRALNLTSAECLCRQCGCVFTSTSGFDRHQTGTRPVECRDPSTFRNRAGDPVFKPVERRGGVSWALAGDRPEFPS